MSISMLITENPQPTVHWTNICSNITDVTSRILERRTPSVSTTDCYYQQSCRCILLSTSLDRRTYPVEDKVKSQHY